MKQMKGREWILDDRRREEFPRRWLVTGKESVVYI